MNHFAEHAEHAERAALREVAHLLPTGLRQAVDLIAEPIPPRRRARSGRRAIPRGSAWKRSITSS